MHASAPKPARTFPAFSLSRLLETVFAPRGGERVALLIDLKDPRDIVDFAFLKNPAYSIQKHAYEVFYQGFQRGELKPLGLTGGDLYAYEVTGGSNLDLPDRAVTPDGREVSLEKDVYSKYDLILCISTYSATAPLTAFAKQFGFRGATLHGLNDIILSSGLAVDYNEVSKHAEKMRLALTNADWFEVDFHVAGQTHTLKLLINGQDAQKSHGLCRGTEPDVANLPAGEVYYVPAGAEGRFPMRYETGTLALMDVAGGRIVGATLIEGDQAEVDAHNAKLQSDPVTGEIGELGFGTQDLPVSGRDIQDEKVLGTMHVATGRSDHLGGHLVPKLFKNAKNATHDDILFSPAKTPEIEVTEVRMHRDGRTVPVLQHFAPAPYLLEALSR
jgi:aminopeptidase